MSKEDRTILVIDTSTAVLSIALLKGDQLLGEINEQVGRRHSDRLLPAIEQLVASQHLSMKQIEGIAVGHGPGSYTGVRIGVTAAKTLAWTLNLPIVTISSLAAMAYRVVAEDEFITLQQQEGEAADSHSVENKSDMQSHQLTTKSATWIVPMIDARRKRVYTALYEASQEKWTCLIEDRVQEIDQWQVKLQQYYVQATVKPEHIMFIGEVEPYRNILKQLVDIPSDRIEVLHHGMRAYTLGRYAQNNWESAIAHDIHHIVPNYTQRSEAEVQLAAKQQQ